MGAVGRRAQDAGAASKGRRKILRKVPELKKKKTPRQIQIQKPSVSFRTAASQVGQSPFSFSTPRDTKGKRKLRFNSKTRPRARSSVLNVALSSPRPSDRT